MPKARTTAIYTSPQDAALAFYQAFEAQDIDAMMATWADDEDIVCVHPGGARGAAAATNIFMRTPSGWRLVCHHASPVTAVVMPQPTGPLH